MGNESPICVMCKSDPGNVDLLNTMPLPDSAANAGTPMPRNIVDREREQKVHKPDRFEKANKKLTTNKLNKLYHVSIIKDAKLATFHIDTLAIAPLNDELCYKKG